MTLISTLIGLLSHYICSQVRLLLADYWNSLKSEIPPEVLARTRPEPPAQEVFAPRNPKYPKSVK